MAKILDSVEMAQDVARPDEPRAEPDLPPIEDVRKAALDFLSGMPDTKQANVTKLALMDPEKGAWEAEGDVFVPNATIKSLGLGVRKEVLDCQTYLLRLDGQLKIVAYGLKDSIET